MLDLIPRAVLITVLAFGQSFSALGDVNVRDERTFPKQIPNKIQIVRGAGNYPPMEMVEGGVLTGLHIEMIYYVANKLNIEVEFLSLPWARAIKYFSEGNSHAISYFGFTEKRKVFSYYHRGNVLSDTRWVLLALEERKNEFQFDRDLQGLGDVVIGVQNEYSHGIHFDSMKHLQLDVVLHEFDLEKMLKNKRHDLVMMSHQEFLGFKKRGDFKGIVALSPSIDSDPQYIAFSKLNDTDGILKNLSLQFSLEMERLKASPDYQKLLDRFNFHQYQ